MCCPVRVLTFVVMISPFLQPSRTYDTIAGPCPSGSPWGHAWRWSISPREPGALWNTRQNRLLIIPFTVTKYTCTTHVFHCLGLHTVLVSMFYKLPTSTAQVLYFQLDLSLTISLTIFYSRFKASLSRWIIQIQLKEWIVAKASASADSGPDLQEKQWEVILANKVWTTVAWFHICFLQYSTGKYSTVGTINLIHLSNMWGLCTLLSKLFYFILSAPFSAIFSV